MSTARLFWTLPPQAQPAVAAPARRIRADLGLPRQPQRACRRHHQRAPVAPRGPRGHRPRRAAVRLLPPSSVAHDGGYLRALVETCRTGCRALPSYPLVREVAVREARRAQCSPSTTTRTQSSAKPSSSSGSPASTPATSKQAGGSYQEPRAHHSPSTLCWPRTEPHCSESEIAGVCAAFFLALGDHHDVRQLRGPAGSLHNGDHSFVSHYPDPDSAVRGIRTLVQTSIAQACALRNGQRHAVIAASMIAMYSPRTRPHTTTARWHRHLHSRWQRPHSLAASDHSRMASRQLPTLSMSHRSALRLGRS